MNARSVGVVIGVVTNREDPDGQGRVEVEFPWLDNTLRSAWASVASPMAGGGRGLYFMPEDRDEVLLAFQHGDFDHPYIVGFMWNGVHQPPSGDVRQRMIRSKNGHTIRFVDSTPTGGDNGALIIEDANGNLVTLSNGRVTVSSVGVLELSAPQIVLSGPGYRRVVAPISRPI
jgi:uncharacterized protein involved in type VI secretion and phage assembly